MSITSLPPASGSSSDGRRAANDTALTTAADYVARIKLDTDTTPRAEVGLTAANTGAIRFGTGSAAADAQMRRGAAGCITVSDPTDANDSRLDLLAASGKGSSIAIYTAGDTAYRTLITQGNVKFSPGNSAIDARIGRTDTKKITIDDNASGAVTVDIIGSLLVNGVALSGGKSPKVQKFTADGNWTRPVGVDLVEIIAFGGGGGGGSVNSGSRYAGGGGGGACFQGLVDVTGTAEGADIAVDIATGGSGGVSGGSASTAGGNTTFGALATAYGGAAGPAIVGTAIADGADGGCGSGGGSYGTNLRGGGGGGAGGPGDPGMNPCGLGGVGSQGGGGGGNGGAAGSGAGGMGLFGRGGGGGGGGNANTGGPASSGGARGGSAGAGASAAANTAGGGGGAGGSSANGGAGGSGYLEVRWVE